MDDFGTLAIKCCIIDLGVTGVISRALFSRYFGISGEFQARFGELLAIQDDTVSTSDCELVYFTVINGQQAHIKH